jgi:hypothetical protein
MDNDSRMLAVFQYISTKISIPEVMDIFFRYIGEEEEDFPLTTSFVNSLLETRRFEEGLIKTVH